MVSVITSPYSETKHNVQISNCQEDLKNYLASFDQDVFKKPKDFYDHAFESKFEFGTSTTKLGERVSTACSLGRNESRGLEGLSRRERKVTEAKVDILFKAGRHEVGSCEVGKEDVLPIDDKYLDDGMIKLPKTLRDMLSRLVKANPVKVNSLL